ncbi:MAG: 1-acyl-sn-glycerol-3-phosphate acyltransferase [Bacteroidota bacterium]
MESTKTSIKYIDIEKIIIESKSGVLKKLPIFIIKLIKKIIRQDDINQILNKYEENKGVEFLDKVIEELNIRIFVEGKENLPENGKCFFAANHPFGIVDGLVLTHTVAQKYGTLKAIANDAFMFIPQMHPLVAAVNVFGRSPREYMQGLDETYNSDTPITHFPAGLVSRVFSGKIQDSIWQKSFITKAISSERDIVPFYFYGRNSILFYSIYLVRKLFGIKLNIELALLPHEMFNKRNKTIKVKIGKPISYQSFDKTFTHLEWAQKVKMQVYELGKK